MTNKPSDDDETAPDPDAIAKRDPGEQNVPAEQRAFAPVKDPVPDGTWKMVRKTLRNLGYSDEITPSEAEAATLVYLKDESSMHSRTGGALTGIGGSLAAGGGAWTLFDAEAHFATYVAVFGLAALAVGQFAKFYGAHREGVGPMAAAIIEDRKDKPS